MLEIEIIKKIKRTRRNKGMTLRRLAERTGLTEGYLSRIENSENAPPISTLGRIANGLDIDISFLFLPENHTEKSNPDIVIDKGINIKEFRFGAKLRQNGSKSYQYEPLAKEKRGKNMEPYVVVPDFEVGGVVKHQGENFIYVLEGTVELFYGT